MTARTESPWTPELDAELRRLAASGETYGRIGRRLGLSKNSVVGRAHRLGLPARSSPVPAWPADRPASPTRAAPRPVPRSVQRSGPRSVPQLASRLVVPPPAPPPRPFAVVRTCQWIEGLPAGVDTLFCGDATQPGSSYCAAHHARCWHRRGLAA